MSDLGPTLLFKAGKFVLLRPLYSHRKAIDTTYWARHEDGSYVTSNLREAAAFRRHADVSAEKIFERAFQKHYGPPRLPPLPFLDSHQLDGVKWVLSRKRSYLAHAPGAGKTCEAIVASCFVPGPGVSLFIVPPQLTANWERELMKFTKPMGIWPAIGVVPLTAKRDDMAWRADFIICPDSMLTKEWVYTELARLPKRFIAVDEASRLKEISSARSEAFYGMALGRPPKFDGLFQDARHVVFLDGSPMPNRPMELWAPTYALHPEAIDMMDQQAFGMRYCGAKLNERGNWEFKHSSNEAELKARLQKDFMHVVSEDQLEHPERRRSILFMNEDVRSVAHRSWERKHLSHLTLADMHKIEDQGDVARFRKELGLRKVPWVSEYTRTRLDKNESILLFAWHREVCENLSTHLAEYCPGIIYGGTHAGVREKLLDQFQRGRLKLLILNILAGGRGHNIQRGDRLIFAEFAWGDEANKQCEHRIARRGNLKRYVRSDYIACPGSMDEIILKSNFAKAQRTGKIIG